MQADCSGLRRADARVVNLGGRIVRFIAVVLGVVGSGFGALGVTREDEARELESIASAAIDGLSLGGGELSAGKRLAHIGEGIG